MIRSGCLAVDRHSKANRLAVCGRTKDQSSPVSQAVVGREEIADRDVRLIDKAIQDVPGVISLRAQGGPDSDFGLGLRGFAGRGGQVRTLILLDDQPINNGFNGALNWAAFCTLIPLGFRPRLAGCAAGVVSIC
jgi:outer membrane receptor for ferrienterochelin and colicin